MDTIIVKANKKQSKIVREFLESQKVKYAISSEERILNDEESPYDPEFVEMVLKAKKGKSTKLNPENIWKVFYRY